MGELKPEWKRVCFGQVVHLSKDSTKDPIGDGLNRYVGLEHIEPGDLRVRSWGDVSDGTTFTRRFRPGQVLFGKRRAYQRKIAVADFEGVCSGDIYVFEPKDPKVLLPELLPFLCQTDAFFEHAIGTSAGSLSPRTNWKSLSDFMFALPPLEEQRRMIEVFRASTLVQERLLDVRDANQLVLDSFCSTIVNREDTERAEVGSVAKFTSGKSIKVSGLSKEPTDDAAIPVYGGNGISGYTASALPGIRGATVVLGRVGQYCGVTHLVTGSAWITDNALFPKRLDQRVSPMFLAICLRGSGLNRSKLGEYLPLITQKVVHAATLPLLPRDEQQELCLAYERLLSTEVGIRDRLSEATRLHQTVLGLVMEAGQ